MSAGRAFDLGVVFAVGGLGYVFGGPTLGWVFLVLGVLFFVLASQKRRARGVDSVVPPNESVEMLSSSAMIQFIRDAYRHKREQ